MRVYCHECKSMTNPSPRHEENGKVTVKYPCCGKTLSREEAAKDRVYQVNHYFLADGREIVRSSPPKPTWEVQEAK